jgi:hypothetical protein
MQNVLGPRMLIQEHAIAPQYYQQSMGQQPRGSGCFGGIIAITPTAKSAQRPGWSGQVLKLGISDDAPCVPATKDHERALALTLASKSTEPRLHTSTAGGLAARRTRVVESGEWRRGFVCSGFTELGSPSSIDNSQRKQRG